MMKFAANISTLFKEHEFVYRFKEAKNNGFEAVEIQFPYEIDINTLKEIKQKENMKVVLINSYPGEGNNFGYCCIPGEEMLFSQNLQKSVDVSIALECHKLHILAGLKSDKFPEDEQNECYIRNLQTAADVLKEHNMIGVIEPICPQVKANYFMDSFEKAINIINKVKKENIKLLLDVYHLHKIEGKVMENLENFYPYAGHIQISQDPGRTEPFLPGGKINYYDVLHFFKEKEHCDFIGLEYFSSGSTKTSFEWIKNWKGPENSI